MSEVKTLCIVNERAGGGAMSEQFRRAEHELEDAVGPYEVAFTEARGHAMRLAREAVSQGIERLIVAGGDGTLNEVVNGLFDESGERLPGKVRVGLLAGGTGGDFRRLLRIPDMAAALAALRADRTRRLDLGKVSCRDAEGREMTRLYINIASFGLSGLVDRHVASLGSLPGPLAYAGATFRSLLGWQNPTVRLAVDEDFSLEAPVTLGAIANGTYFGGGMRIAPDAKPDDGLLDVTLLVGFTRLEVIGLTRTVYEGGHIYDPKVVCRRGTVVTASSEVPVMMDIDGEPIGHLPARVEVLPSALDFIVPDLLAP
jgi:YegS/Rv2252/BmrU family lipid kinase